MHLLLAIVVVRDPLGTLVLVRVSGELDSEVQLSGRANSGPIA
jgi:hypothetical protein